MDVFRQRLEDEYDANIIITAPTVPYKGEYIKPDLSSDALHVSYHQLYIVTEKYSSATPQNFQRPPTLQPEWKRFRNQLLKRLLLYQKVLMIIPSLAESGISWSSSRIFWGYDGTLLLTQSWRLGPSLSGLRDKLVIAYHPDMHHPFERNRDKFLRSAEKS